MEPHWVRFTVPQRYTMQRLGQRASEAVGHVPSGGTVERRVAASMGVVHNTPNTCAIGSDLEVTDWRGMRNLEDLNLYPRTRRGGRVNCEFAKHRDMIPRETTAVSTYL
jgi:hypothetical protein